MYHASVVQGLKKIIPRTCNAYKEKDAIVFASSNISFAACFGARWKDDQVRIATWSNEDNEPNETNVYQVEIHITDRVDIHQPCSMYWIEGDFEYLRNQGDLEKYSKEVCKVLKEVKFNNWIDMLKEYSVTVM